MNSGFLQELYRFKKGFRVLQQICTELARPGELNVTLKKIIHLTASFMNIKRASIMLLENDGRLRIKAHYGMPAHIADVTAVKLGDEISGRVAQNGIYMMSSDISKDPEFKRAPRSSYETNSYICMPVISHNKAIGVININDKINKCPFDQIDRELLFVIAQQTATVIELFHLYKNLNTTIHKLNETNQELTTSQLWLQSVIKNIYDGVILTNLKGQVLLYNEKATHFFPGVSTGCDMFLITNSQSVSNWLRECYFMNNKDHNNIYNYQETFKYMNERSFRINTMLIKASKPDNSYFLNIFSDITRQIESRNSRLHFVTSISHELRTPLTAIKAYTSSIKAGLLGDISSELFEAVNTISQAVNRLQCEVDNLVLMGMLHDNNEQPETESVRLIDEIQDIMNNFLEESDFPAINIVTCFGDQKISVWCNRKLIRIALRNLLGYTIKLGTNKSQVVIKTRNCITDQIPCLNISVFVGQQCDPDHGFTNPNFGETYDSSLTMQYNSEETELFITKRIVQMHRSVLFHRFHTCAGHCFSFNLAICEDNDCED